MSQQIPQNQEITTKVYYRDQIRRFTLNRSTDFKTFVSYVSDLYQTLDVNPIFKYQDEEKEYVTFSTESEWQEVLKQKFDILRIAVEEKKKVKKNPFGIQPGDVVYELNDKEVKEYLKSGEINVKLPPSGHFGVICDGCNASDFHGDRYHCLACPDFDFCGKCMKQYDSKHFHGVHKFECIKESVCKFDKIVSHVVHEKKIKRTPEEKAARRLARDLEKQEIKNAKREEKELKKEEKEKKKEEKLARKNELVIDTKPEVKKEEIVKKEDKPKVIVPEFKDVVVVSCVEPSAPKLETEFKKDEKYSIHYKILENMGFTNSEVTTNLLKQHSGNLQKVVDALLGSQ